MIEQRFASFGGTLNEINCWLEENNKNGWYIKTILENTRLTSYVEDRFYITVLIEKGTKNEKSNND